MGDIHRRWDHVARGLAALAQPPEAVVLLGDMECHEPLDALAAPIIASGASLHWIFGNHDYDGGPDMWANLADPALNPLSRSGALHAQVREVAGVRIAGLGGTFRPRVWLPPNPPRLHRRAELPEDMTTLGPGWSEQATAALAHSLGVMAIWPEDYAALASQRADVLVTHEAPSSHPSGVVVLEELARAMGARLHVHGHHHVNYRAHAEDGLRVLGVGAGWGVSLAGTAHWSGEPERWFGRAPTGWQFAAG